MDGSELHNPQEKKEKKPKRAGVILYGWANDPDGYRRLHTLAAYTEGRYCENVKCYGVPQGSVDRGESILAAARREAYEETGVDLEKLLGASAYAQLAKGHAVQNVTSLAYPGVTVVSASPIPIQHTYLSSHGAMHEGHYFTIEVDGIKNLIPNLKRLHAQENSLSAKVTIPTRQHVKNNGMPDFEEMLTLLRTGIAPAHSKVGNGNTVDEIVIEKPEFPVLKRLYHQSGEIKTMKQWVQFCNDLPGGQAYRSLLGDLETIKKYFERNGLVSDVGPKLKLDTKDRPLTFYQEGAEIIPMGLLFERSAKVANKNPLYARMMWGDYTGPRRNDVDTSVRLQTAQIKPFSDLAARLCPMELGVAITATAKQLHAVKHGEASALGTGFAARVLEHYTQERGSRNASGGYLH